MNDKYSDDIQNKPAAEYDSFCDFVQFEAGNSYSSKTEVAAETLMQKCIRNYLGLFTKFVDMHISRNVELFFREFLNMNSICSRQLGEDDPVHVHNSPVVGRLPIVSRVGPINGTKNIVEAFNVACQLLVDLSALPIGHPATDVTSSGMSGFCFAS